MNFDVNARTIYLAKHGSHAYGTNVETSDLDVKGICIPPVEYYLGFLKRFEQHERMGNNEGGNLHVLKAFKGKDCDIVIYSLTKFAKLAADCNPNIIEVLHVDDGDIIAMDSFGEELRAHRQLFMSKKARHTFSGYAHAQLKRIKTHRSWLLNPPAEPPDRKSFGLPEQMKVSKSELGAFLKLEEEKRTDHISKEALQLFTRERAYQNLVTQWKQYQNWKLARNDSRAALEAKYGYDTKHGMHLLRLMRMCKEILETGSVNVKRPDAEELLGVRFGKMSYDELIEEAERLDTECDTLYKTSNVLPHKPDLEKLDALVIKLTETYLSSV